MLEYLNCKSAAVFNASGAKSDDSQSPALEHKVHNIPPGNINIGVAHENLFWKCLPFLILLEHSFSSAVPCTVHI